jgi:hypothetical protein
MLNTLAIASALKAFSGGIQVLDEDDEVVTEIRKAFIGVNENIPDTPCASVAISTLDLPNAQNMLAKDENQIAAQISVFARLTRNLEQDETLLYQLVDEFGKQLTADTFDYTLGGLCDDVQYMGAALDTVLTVNNYAYRRATLRLMIYE